MTINNKNLGWYAKVVSLGVVTVLFTVFTDIHAADSFQVDSVIPTVTQKDSLDYTNKFSQLSNSLTILTSQPTKSNNQQHQSEGHGDVHSINQDGHAKLPPISFLWCIPFILILLCIAILPLVAPHFWHRNYWKISLFVFGLPMLMVSMFLLNEHVQEKMIHEIQSYISFILLLASLFTISGAVVIRGSLVGRPTMNAMLIAIGGVLASFMATTGASMLLIRPLIRANQFRYYKVHTIIFFIFVVSNTGGLLTPLGDPPLFLGYLKGVPFTWTFNLFFQWLFVNAILVSVYLAVDSFMYSSEKKKGLLNNDLKQTSGQHFAIDGKIQFLFLLGVVLSIYFQGYFSRLALSNPDFSWWPHFGFQEIFMLAMMIGSLLVAKPKSQIRQDNEFTWFPIKEVASLFAGIFACMVPALYLLQMYGAQLGVQHSWQFFWITGLLSSFLDNAPTYLVFLELAKSTLGTDVAGVVAHSEFLVAISCGAVFMGAMTYIGNAPNFMVSSIARERGIAMPSFFGYMLYSIVILLPIFLMLTWFFLL